MADLDHGSFSRRDGIIAQEAHGQTVLLRLSDGSYYTLEGVGAAVWDLCEAHITFDEIVRDVCANFEAPPDVVRSDVREFIDELVAERLLDRLD
jgi:Coenzyme PQQ synthesis protein D (PqqD)